MTYLRRQFGPISIEVPPGLFEDDEAPAGFIAAITAIEPTTLRIRTIDLSGSTSVAAALREIQHGSPREVDAAGEMHLWPGLAVDAPGEPRRVHYLFESGSQGYHGVAEAANDLWTDYGTFLEGAMLSLDLAVRPEPLLPLFNAASPPLVSMRPPTIDPVAELKHRLADVSEAVVQLILALRFEEAEALVKTIDWDIHGAVALAGAYEAALKASPAEVRILDRAIYWARSANPEPHTTIEAEAYQSASEEREARLTTLYRAT